ncbi:10081_t:CDS:2 [Diversispora eburnea]|uniref:10081_t:CDS:1 n=1 Tax=Diversispora eburnea TaxID=1213867 RepID=A0A9N9GV07_9GLOM|nr:10081_t:CDS:2 [Diversispora eburnea]
MRGSWSDFSIRDTINWVDRSSPSNTPPTNLSIKEKLLKNIFIAGLNPKNQLMAEEYRKKLPLEGLVKLLTMNEIRAKHDPLPPYHP